MSQCLIYKVDFAKKALVSMEQGKERRDITEWYCHHCGREYIHDSGKDKNVQGINIALARRSGNPQSYVLCQGCVKSIFDSVFGGE